MLLFAPPHRIVDTDLGRVEIDHPPRDGAMEHLPQRLGCFKAVTGRERHPPLRDLLRRQLPDAAITEHRGRLAEQIAELLDRHRLRVVLREVRLHEFGEREPACDASLTSQQLALECITRILLRGKPAPLDPLRVAAAGPEAIRPQPLTAGSATREFDCLSLLHHRWDPLLSGVDPLPARSSLREGRRSGGERSGRLLGRRRRQTESDANDGPVTPRARVSARARAAREAARASWVTAGTS